jgi:hypothetical protein
VDFRMRKRGAGNAVSTRGEHIATWWVSGGDVTSEGIGKRCGDAPI